MKSLVIMPYWHANFENRFSKLVKILRQNHSVDFCVLTKEMNKRNELHAPGTPKERLSLSHFRELDAQPIDSTKELYKHVLEANFVLMGTTKGLEKVNEIISRVGLPFILINDVGDSTPFTYSQDILAVPGEAFKKNTLFNKSSLKDKIFITGDIRFDSVIEDIPESEVNNFYNKYKLDKSKGFAVFCTGPFQRIDEYAKKIYKEIIECFKISDFQIIIRLHQNDYAGHKRPPQIKVASNILLYPEVPALEPWDVDIAMRLCSFMVVVESSTCLESSIYHKNAIVVNMHEWSLTDEGRKRQIFPEKRFNGFGWKSSYKDKNGLPIQSEYLHDKKSVYRTYQLRVIEFDWIGADCHINELPEVLKSPEILKVDEEACQRHIEKYWYKIDGKASLRIAQLTEEMINNPKFHKRIFMSLHKKMLNSLIYSISSMPKKVVGKLKSIVIKILKRVLRKWG